MQKKPIHLMLAATLFGALVWLLVSLQEQHLMTVSAPLTVSALPEGLAVKTPLPRTVRLRLRGEGWRLAGILLGPDLRVAVDLPADRVESKVIAARDIALRLSLRPGVELVDVTPDSIYVALDRAAERRVPIVFDHALSFREGYGQIGPIGLTPDSVTVAGAAAALASIDSWKTTHTEFTDLKGPVETDVRLTESPVYDLRLSTGTVHVRVNVQPFAEKVLSGLTVEALGVPPNREVILIPPRLELVVRGGIRQLSGLGPGDFRIAIDYGSITADTTGAIAPLVTAPEGVQVVSRHPDRLQYIVRKRL